MMMKLSFVPRLGCRRPAAGRRRRGRTQASRMHRPGVPGGGFDLTCKLAQSALVEAKLLSKPMRVTYMPGGVGAVAYNAVVARPGDAGTITAFSSGSLLNLAQGKFGRFDENAVKWLAAIGTSYGAIAVRTDSPYKPRRPGEGAQGRPEQGGDRLRRHRRQPGLDANRADRQGRRDQSARPALRGPGRRRRIATALLGGHIQVGSTDISDSMPHILSGDMRLLAVFSEERLPEAAMANIPPPRNRATTSSGRWFAGSTRAEGQRRNYAWWKKPSTNCWPPRTSPSCATSASCSPAMTGEELDGYVKQQVQQYKQLAKDFGLIQ